MQPSSIRGTHLGLEFDRTPGMKDRVAANPGILQFERNIMKRIIQKIKTISKIQLLALVLIIIGAAIMIPKATGMLDFYKEVRYAAEHDFAAGNLSPDLLRPWMSIRYVAVAYAVPEKYLFDAVGVNPKKETSLIALNRLNRQKGLGQAGGAPVVMTTVRDAILSYRANPVATGLIEQKVEGWMTVQYIANSTGIPAEAFFTGTGIAPDGNANKPLDFLSDEIKYSGGPSALVTAIQKVLDTQGKKP